MNQRTIIVDEFSVKSIKLETLNAGELVTRATGFIMRNKGVPFLITNWHVVTNKNSETKILLSNGGQPDAMNIWLNKKSQLGLWELRKIKLYDPLSGNPVWIEHPNGSDVDVIAIPLPEDAQIDYADIDISLKDSPIEVRPAETVSVVGFPFGEGSYYNFAVWKTGHVASDFDLNYKDLPVFLVDATTKPSMSGSPVYIRKYDHAVQVNDPNYGSMLRVSKGPLTKFLGVYSGRTNENSDLGRVWKPEVIEEIFGDT